MSGKILVLAPLLAAASLAAAADGTRVAPLAAAGSEWQPSVAVVVGALKPEGSASGPYIGAEISVDCVRWQAGERRLRTHLVIGSFDQKGLQLATAEIWPRYTMPMGSGFSIGIGPGIAYLRSTVAGRTVSHLAWIVGGGVSFRKGAYYAGVDLRYQDTREKEPAGVGVDPDNWVIATKVGYNF